MTDASFPARWANAIVLLARCALALVFLMAFASKAMMFGMTAATIAAAGFPAASLLAFLAALFELGLVLALVTGAFFSELMLLGNSHPRDLAELEEIAPAITLNGRIGTYERIRYIAGLIDRGKAAEEWVSRYEAGVRKVRRKLSEFYTPGERAAVYLILGDNLYVMGQSGFAATLYESLGFRPSDGAAGLIEQGSLWRQVSRDHVFQYAGDRNFVLASGGDLQVAETDPLFAALGSGKRHLVEASWNYDDPITRERLLPVLPHLFMEKLLVREERRLKDAGAFRQESSSR